MSAEADVPDFTGIDEFDGLPEGSYLIVSNKSTRIVTLSYNLNQTEQMNLTVYTYSNNPDEADQPVGSSQETASSGSVSITIPLTYDNTTYYAVVFKNDAYLAPQFIDMKEDSSTYFDAVMGAFLAGILVLTVALMGISQGVLVIVWAVLGLLTAGALSLINLSWLSIMGIVAVAFIMMMKLSQRRGN